MEDCDATTFIKIFSKKLKMVQACVCYFLSKFYFSPNDSPSKTMKNVFISSKKLFSSSRYSNFCISPLFLPVSHCFRGWLKINLEVFDIINCLNKNLITYFAWYFRKKKSYDIETLSIDSIKWGTFLLENYGENKTFWKRIIKKPKKD